MPAAARRAGRGSLVPACVFGRVSLTSCQINIYSQIYLFAFVAENSRGVFFVLFCSPCVFLAARRWREGQLQLCWLQPFQLLPPARGWEPLLYGGARLAAALRLPTAFSPEPPGSLRPLLLVCRQGRDVHSPCSPRGLQDPRVSAPAPSAGAALQPRGAPPASCTIPALLLPSAFIPITANLPVIPCSVSPGAKQGAAGALPSLRLRSSLPCSHRLLPGARQGAAHLPPCPGSRFPSISLLFCLSSPPATVVLRPRTGTEALCGCGTSLLLPAGAAPAARGAPDTCPELRPTSTGPELGVP